MQQKKDFSTIEEFIKHLKSKPEIVGIVQYGGRDYRDMSLGGDYDLNVVLDSDIKTKIAGLHFHINSIPVDCGLISLNDLRQDIPPSDFHCIMLNANILHDPTGIIQELILKIKGKWKLNISPFKESEIAFERFIKQHIVDKFEHRAYEDEVYSRIFLSGNIFFLLEDYMKINQLNPYDFKGALQIMRANDPEVYQLFTSFVKTSDLSKQIEVTKQLNHAVLAKIGGPWQKNEIVFHYKDSDDQFSDTEKQQIENLIF